MDCVGIGDAGLEHLTANNPGLTTLDVFNCVKLSDVGVKSIAKHCPLLRALTLGRMRGVGDAGVSDVASSCKMMRDLNILWCREVRGFHPCDGDIHFSCSFSFFHPFSS